MGTLARFLVSEWLRRPPRGWRCSAETALLDRELVRRYGFDPRADVMFEARDGRRVAVEVEIRRADPVANQVKFLVAMRAGALREGDALVSMFSPAIDRGRRNSSAVFVRHLRTDGLTAFQVALLPDLDAVRVLALNKAPPEKLARAKLPVARELERVFAIVEPRGEREHRIHFAGDVTDVVANVWAWNDEMTRPGRGRWGTRAVQFFVHDPASGLFAPSKFAAFIPAMKPGGASRPPATMTLDVYASLGEQDPRFDGHRARKHLCERLAFEATSLAAAPGAVSAAFADWAERDQGRLRLRRPVQLLQPPRWYVNR